MPHVCWGCVFAIDSHLASSLGFHKPIWRGFYCQLRKNIKTANLRPKKNVFIKRSSSVCAQPLLSYTWLDWEVACGRFFPPSPSVWSGCSGPPSHKESSKSSQVESIYSMLCRWQECWPGRCAAVWVQRVLRWWVSWVQTQAGPLLTRRCLAFITWMGEGFSLL